ncbi:MAG: acetyl-CoA hydrolase [Firmicutes bacterium]|nr:acetyl-CoA hydrolase [Bacillota bacterium]
MNNDWKTLYKDKLVSLEQAASLFNSGDYILVGHTTAYPRSVMNAVVERKELKDLKVFHANIVGKIEYLAPENWDRFSHTSFILGPNTRPAFEAKVADYMPFLYYGFAHEPQRLKGEYSYDKLLLNVAPPDENGNLSFGVCCSYLPTMIRDAKVIIAQINENMPFVHGDYLNMADVDYLVDSSDPVFYLPEFPLSDTDRKIGSLAAELIEDGSTIQVGIGGIPKAVLAGLETKNDLGIHSEMMSDGMYDLIEKGVITNAKKTINKGKSITTFLLGGEKLSKYAHNNPAVEVRSGEYTNDPFVISQNYKFVSVNSALQIDLTGQINAESLGFRQYSGTGGHMDFVYGALRAPGGKSIIAIESTAGSGKHSRIVPAFAPGTVVTTPRTMIDYVVTEYGAVQLKGKKLRERAKLLIEVSHPDFREELTSQAHKVGLLN